MPISNSHNALPQGQKTKVQAPLLFSDRFRLNKTLGFFYGLDSFVRLEVPNYITEDRQDGINDVAFYNSNLMRSRRDDGNLEDSFAPLAIGMQLKIELPPIQDGESSLSSHVIMSLSKFQRDLEEGIRLGNLVLSNPLSSDDERGTVSLVLGVLLSYRFKFTKDIQHLDAAVKLLNEAINSSPTPSESWRHECIVVQAVLLTTYYCQTRSKEMFKSAITTVSKAIERFNFDTSTNDSYFALSVCCAVLHGERFFKDPSPLDWIAVLESCIYIIQDERSANISEIFRDDNYRRQTLEKLNLQLSRFHVVIEDLDKHNFPADCDVGSVALVDFVGGAVLSAMWEEYGKRIRKVHPAVALAEILDVNHGISIRYYIGDSKKVREAFSNGLYYFYGLSLIRFHFRIPNAVEIKQKTPSFREFPHTLEQARELSTFYKQKYKTSKDLEDLERAIHYAEIALEGTPSDVDIIEDLVYLSHFYNFHLNEGATLSSTNRIIQYSELALANPELTSKRRYPIAEILALSARQVFLLGSPLNDFDKRIRLVKAIFDDAHSSDHDGLLIPDGFSYALSMCFKARYQNTGEVENLDDCVKFSELSIAFPRLGKQRKAFALNNHGLILRLRYQRTKAFEDLDRAVEAFEEALICDTQPFFHANVLNNLILVRLDRYDRSGDPNEISMAVKHGEEALERMGNDDWESKSPLPLLNLASALSLTNDPIKLDKAVEYVLKAVAMDKTLRSGHQAPNIRNDASEILLHRYELQKKDDDLECAIRLAKEARKLIREGHPFQGEVLLQLGACLSLKDRSEISLQSCINIYLEAWKCESMLPGKRITAASRAAKFLLEDGQVMKAAQLLEDSIELMPSIDARWTQRTDRHGQDSTAFCLSIPANAAMVALKAGRNAEHALKLLEIGRARTLGSLIDLRTEVPVSDDPDNLVRAFNLLRIKADAATTLSEESLLREKMRMILRDIRGRPGFENFTFPPTANDYMKLAREGPIVVLITSELVDPGVAIIVTGSRIYSLPLVKMTHVETTRRLREMSEEMICGGSETYSSRNKMMVALLTWLWDAIVQPVFRDLDFHKTTEPLPYIRWIGIGPLAKAPLHVAGKYKVKGTPYSAMDYAISSYAPSLRALLYATERGPKQYLNQRCDARVLVVKMSETLAHVEEEANTLKGIALSVSMHTTELDVPTTTEVLKQLPLHNLVHFACHAIIDPEVPSNSHFLLSDGKLTVQQILKTYSAEPDVAFLSACSTAECGDARLVDESIHIASAFLVLGFKQIIGTLWEGSDRACMEISNRFYEKLLGEDESKWDGSWKATLALHHAVKELQKLQPKHALIWAPFVAFGP
jgi:CHAT domain-containing protein/tetratricopeptide (TPR) repeat protein